MVDTRTTSPRPSRWRLIAIQPAKAWVTYGLGVLMFATLVLGAIAYVDLLERTRAVCAPLRAGQQVDTSTTAGREFAAVFGRSADELGCTAPTNKESR